jgi:hypothetical protein
MILLMTRPSKHPKSGIYWLRKRVPDDLRNLIGKREEHFSLGTRDPSEAKRLHALKLAEVEERWANLRVGQRPLSPDDLARLASEIGEQLRRQLEADPYQPLRWDVEIGTRLWTASDTHDVYTDITQPLSPADRKRLDQQNICYVLVDERLNGRGVAAHPEDRERLARAASLQVQRIIQNHEAYLLGRHEVSAGGWEPSKLRVPATPLTFEAVIQGWLVEKKPNEKTEYTWRRVMTELSEFVGHDDARRVSADNRAGKQISSPRGGQPRPFATANWLRYEQFFKGRSITANSIPILLKPIDREKARIHGRRSQNHSASCAHSEGGP